MSALLFLIFFYYTSFGALVEGHEATMLCNFGQFLYNVPIALQILHTLKIVCVFLKINVLHKLSKFGG